MVGIPGSGKSTWAKDYINNVNRNAIILSRDSLRRMRGTYMLIPQENMISKWMLACFTLALNEKQDIIIDNTNLKEHYYIDFLDILKNHENSDFYEIYIKIIDTDLQLCLYRNTEGRPVDERVPVDVVNRMYDNYIKFVDEDRLKKFLDKHNIKKLDYEKNFG